MATRFTYDILFILASLSITACAPAVATTPEPLAATPQITAEQVAAPSPSTVAVVSDTHPTAVTAPVHHHSGGCGSRGGPGYRLPDGKCASWHHARSHHRA
jgi:hypothetical protein